MSVTVGDHLGPYEILAPIGAGGMGEVWKARDTRLGRDVAIKISREKFSERFEREARAIAALNHPNICTLYDVGPNYLVMEFVDGAPLKGPLAWEKAIEYGKQICDALDAAHRKGIVHRDLKPGNILVTQTGVKVLDFGLAKMSAPVTGPAEATQTLPLTGQGTILGTLQYMSPEQLEGKDADARSDIFSFGSVLYEMVTGHRAFEGKSTASILAAVMRENPRPVDEFAKDAPAGLARIITRCLKKDREARYASMADVSRDLEDCRSALAATSTGLINLKLLARWSKRPKVAVAAILILLLLAGGAGWLLQRYSGTRWAREQAIPEISRLIEEEKFTAAYALAEEAEKYIPKDANLVALWPKISRTVTIQTTPPGADIYWKDYTTPDAPWKRIGVSPLDNVRVPFARFRWKIEKGGFETMEGAFARPRHLASVILDEAGKRPTGMVRVSAGNSPTFLVIPGYEDVPPVPLEDYWIDKYEVTNRQFKEFVDRGGYRKPEYWKQQFRKDGIGISWTDAMTLFRDATGRAGPAGWVQSDYPAGQDDYPVRGVSWFEAAAYAEFAGKTLPTIWHWNKAAGTGLSGSLVPVSNFRGQGPARVGSYQGLGPWGTYDMGGNVKEWCWNQAGPGLRYILGGGWDEPGYMFEDPDARSPFERSANFGFRCVKYLTSNAIPKLATDQISSPARDYSREKPVSDELFRAYKSLYSYDKTPLHAVVESVDDSNESWKREKIAFDAAYGNERVMAYLFLPRRFTHPLQAVVFFPGSFVIAMRSSATLAEIDMAAIDFVIKSGRAVLYPVYKGTYERGDALKSDEPDTSSSYRDHVIAWSKDLGRSIDYLESRQEIDPNKFAYYGLSWGAAMGAILPAVESRIKVCVFYIGGFYLQKALPEVDQINFAPRVKVPALMLNGRYDFFCPIQACQLPLYRFLGASEEHKRHMLYDGGHNIPRNELIKETLNWLDRYLGPVK